MSLKATLEEFQARLTVLAVDDAGMSTVEYAKS